MNFTSISGFTIAALILWLGVIHPAPRPELFLDHHALLLVLGGTAAAAMIAFPLSRLADLWHLFIYGFLLKKTADNRRIASELISAAAEGRLAPDSLAKRKPKHPFISEGYQLIAEGFIHERQLREILMQRSDYFKKAYQSDAKTLTALAKFPPAFGLLGTSTGMITMMINLGGGGSDSIGPAMASALVATFWGIALANLVLLPLADYANKVATDDSQSRKLIVEGLIMIKQGLSPMLVAEHLNSHLAIHERMRVVLENGKVSVVPRQQPLKPGTVPFALPDPPARASAPAPKPSTRLPKTARGGTLPPLNSSGFFDRTSLPQAGGTPMALQELETTSSDDEDDDSADTQSGADPKTKRGDEAA